MSKYPLPMSDKQEKYLTQLKNFYSAPIPTTLNKKQPQLKTESLENLLVYDFEDKSSILLPSSSNDPLTLREAFISSCAPSIELKCEGIANRTKVADSTKFPFSAVCRIIMDYGGFASGGTGVLIGKNCVLACGHLLHYNPYNINFPKDVYVEPGVASDYHPFGLIKVKKAGLIQSFLSDDSAENDFCLLLLEEEIGLSTGWMGISHTPLVKNEEIVTVGYPWDLSESKFQYQDCGNLESSGEFLAGYNFFVFGGQSGSPVCRKTGFSTTDTTVFSILTTSIGNWSSGTMLNVEKIHFIKNFIQSFSSF